MALDMSPQEKAVGRANFNRTVGKLAVNRRQFMQGLIAAGATVPVAAAAYFGYNNDSFRERPVRAALIGAGDEGGVLVGEHNPRYLEFVAVCDIRPSNYEQRIWRGEERGPRRGFNFHYGNNAHQRIRHFTDYRQMLNDASLNLEAVVIALPLHLHAPVVIDSLRAGKHVLCEKLMAWNILECKDMIRAANEADKVLAVGHQRHYSMLYAHANEVIQSGVLGEIRHIRALWHRNNANPLTPGDPRWNPQDPYALYKDSWRPAIAAADRQALNDEALHRHGFRNIEELVRWRLFQRTGGGLMAELGSHQLDACSIFLGKVHPLAVTGVGGKFFYKDEREIEDCVFCTFEFPGKNYWREAPSPQHPDGVVGDRNDVIVVTYSSISNNGFEPYGECVMGSKGTLVTEQEQTAMLWGVGGRSTAVSVNTQNAGAPALTSSASDSGADRQATEVGQNAIGHAAPSRGYREEMEHFAYIIRMRDQGMQTDRNRLKPRCDGPAAMGDAIMALTANQAMHHKRRIEFKPRWYDPAARERNINDVPDPDQQVQGPLPQGH